MVSLWFSFINHCDLSYEILSFLLPLLPSHTRMVGVNRWRWILCIGWALLVLSERQGLWLGGRKFSSLLHRRKLVNRWGHFVVYLKMAVSIDGLGLLVETGAQSCCRPVQFLFSSLPLDFLGEWHPPRTCFSESLTAWLPWDHLLSSPADILHIPQGWEVLSWPLPEICLGHPGSGQKYNRLGCSSSWTNWPRSSNFMLKEAVSRSETNINSTAATTTKIDFTAVWKSTFSQFGWVSELNSDQAHIFPIS